MHSFNYFRRCGRSCVHSALILIFVCYLILAHVMFNVTVRRESSDSRSEDLTAHHGLVTSFSFTSSSPKSVNRIKSDYEEDPASKVLLTEDETTVHVQEIVIDIFSSTTLAQDDPLILDYIRNNHLTPPSNKTYNLDKSITSISYKLNDDLDAKLAEIFRGKENGTFVECGALDGQLFSHSLRLETEKNWSGILIEASPRQFQKLKTKNRKAWIADVCLTESHPEQMKYLQHVGNQTFNEGNGQLLPIPKYGRPRYFDPSKYAVLDGVVDCFPLYSILRAANLLSIDFFSLDIEGHEYKVLKGIPFDRLDIKFIAVEHWLAPEGKAAIRTLMESQYYRIIFETEADYIFSHKSV